MRTFPTVNAVPRRVTPDPLAKRIGARIRSLREEAGITLEALAYESELGSKGHLSDVERGLTRPTVATLSSLAERLGVELFDLVVFPDDNDRHRLVEETRRMSRGQLRRLLRNL